jgi:hypothetical protein
MGWQEYFQAFHLMQASDIAIALFLVTALVVSYYFPINIRLHTKLQMTTVPMYLLAILLSPALAIIAMGIGTFIAEMAVRSSRRNRPTGIAFQSARCILITLPAAWIAHLPNSIVSDHTVLLICAALCLFASDFLTFSFQQFVLFAEDPWKMLLSCLCDASISEGAQYLLGLLGALAVIQEVWALAFLAIPVVILYIASKRAMEIQHNTRQLLESMADAVDLRDAYTGGHSRRVTTFTAQILKELDLHGPEVELIVTAARVHDIGKIGIPDYVLNKTGKLTAEERALMETHPAQGAELLKRYSDFKRGTDIVMHHHESWDGAGYPHKLKGINIPFGARVIAVADSFDAMTSDRPYRKGMPVAKAISILRDGRNQQWDATIVNAFLRSMTEQTELEAPSASRILEFTPPVKAADIDSTDLVSSVPA